MFVLWILTAIKTFLFTYLTEVDTFYIGISLMTLFISWLILGLLSWLPGKVGKWASIIFYSLLSFSFFADAMYYSYFWGLITIETIVNQGGQVNSIGDSIVMLLTAAKLALLVDLPFIYIFHEKIDRWSEKVVDKLHLRLFGYGEERQSGKIFIALLVAVLLLFAGIYESGGEPVLFSQEFYHFHTGNIAKAGPIYSGPKKDDNKALFTLTDYEELKENAQLKEGKWTGVAKGKNLIVIQVESLQNFVIDLKVGDQVVTPNLNELLREEGGLYYDDYFHVTAMGSTSDAEFVTHNSLHPSTEGPTYHQYDENTHYSLPWLLRDHGYQTAVFHGYDKTFWNRDKMYPAMGFEEFIGEEDYVIKEKIGFGLTDKDFYDQTVPYLEKMEDKGKPFYAFLITLTSHTPYEMPKEYQKLKLPSYVEGTYLGNYLQAIHYADATLGQFIKELKKNGLYDESLIAIYGDHYGVQSLTPEIGELMEKFLGQAYLEDMICNVPLILRVPGIKGHETISDTCSMMDFYPTITNLLGLDNEKGLIFGEDINNKTKPHVVTPQTILRRGSFITDDYIYAIGRDEIYDRGTLRDRHTRQTVNDPAIFEELRPIYEQTIRDIGLGEYILRRDLLKPMLAGEDMEMFLAEDDRFFAQDNLYYWRDGAKSSLRRAYENGARQVLVTGQWMEVPHGRNKAKRLILGEEGKGMDLSVLLKMLDDYPDLRVVLEGKPGVGETFFEETSQVYKDAPEKLVAGIQAFDEHFYVSFYGFHNLVLDLRYGEVTDQELEDFIEGRFLPGVILPDDHDGELVNTSGAQSAVSFFRRPYKKGFLETKDDEALGYIYDLP